MSDSSKSALSLISMHRGYSESEQRIVDYILEHQSEAPRLTAAQLSRAVFSFRWRAIWRVSATKDSLTRYRSTIWSRASRIFSLPR